MVKLVNKFEVGCDPEFVVLDKDGELVRVAKLGQHGPVGFDHGGDVAELRPEEARGTWTVVKRLQALITNPYPSLKPFEPHRWRAGGYIKTSKRSLTLGGHVHFNIPKVTPVQLTALNSVTKAMENLEILPKAECINRRTQSDYGKWGDVRTSGANYEHVEFRTMASWLTSPWTAFLALTLGKLAIVAPVEAKDLEEADSHRCVVQFLERFKGKDGNVDRLLEKLDEDAEWLVCRPDDDFKKSWAKPLGVRR